MKKAIIISVIAVAAVSVATAATVAIQRAKLRKALADIAIDEKEAE